MLAIGAFSAVSGIGGGGFYVVILFLMLEFPIEVSARLSTSTIFGMAIVNVLNYMPLKHLKQNKPMIDYDTAVMMESYTLAGTVFGVILNIIFPGWLISILLVMILIFVGIKVIRRYWKLTREEDDEDTEDVELEDVVVDAAPLSAHKKVNGQYHVLPKISILILCWILIVMFSIIKGGKSGNSVAGVEQCSALFLGIECVTSSYSLHCRPNLFHFPLQKTS